jgi:hypothetical protein
MKTGTTFIQKVLVENQRVLADDGYLFPGETWVAQIRAAQEVADAAPDDPVIRAEARGAWSALAQQMLAHDGVGSIVSMEILSHADRRGAATAVSSLRPADVHVILTVRDATATIPAQWQTAIRNGRTFTWPEFMRRVRRAGGLRARPARLSDPVAVMFRRVQDTRRMVEAWGRQVPPERLHVVTVPPSGGDPTLLWQRFADVIGIDPGMGAATSRANESLGLASTELLRRVNQELGPVRPSDYNATVREHLATRILSTRSSEETRPRLDTPTYDFALRWNRRARRAVISAGAQVAGDLEDLPTSGTPRGEGAVDDDQPPPAQHEVLAAAELALDEMRKLVERRARRAAKRTIDIGDLQVDAPHRLESGDASADAVSAAAAQVADACRTAIELRRRLRS